MSGLTKRQFEALAFIREYIAAHGYSPNYTEIGAAIGIVGRAGIHGVVHRLVARGKIELIEGRARSISVKDAA